MRRREWLIYALSTLGVGALYFWLGRAHIPRATFDSTAYLEAAAKPWSVDQFFYPKPVFVSLFYRLTGADIDTIALVQRLFALAAWAFLAIVLVRCFATRRAKIAAGVVVALFVLAPVRRGYADMILAESINDSLFAIALAALLLALQLRGRQRIIAACGCAVAAIAWTLARDTNAIVLIVAAAFVVALARRSRWVLGITAAPVIVALFTIWSVDVAPEPTHFSAQNGWPTDMTPRGAYAKLDNVIDRVLPDPDAREYFRERGLPQIDELTTIARIPREPARGGLPGDRADVILDGKLAPARTWIANESRGVYLTWLLRHPLDRIVDQVRHAWPLLGAGDHFFMPKGWKRYGIARFIDYAFGILTNRVVIVLLLIAAPLALWRRWQHPLRWIVLALLASGWLGGLAAFYADSSEVGRHCYGHGQQVLFGLCLAALLWLDSRSTFASCWHRSPL